MPSLYEHFNEFVSRHNLLKKSDVVIAGVSGGVDSMVMLYCLLNYRKENAIRLVVVHLNHQIRGSESDRDERLVSDYCQINNCDFICKSVNVQNLARNRGLSLEAAGRAARYHFFRKISLQYPGSVIATAHTADDQVETILLRLLKGTGLNGLRGIRLKRGNIVRPLLFAFKSELYEYARSNGVPFSEDHTNRDTAIPRNYIRHSLLPVIKSEINPAADNAILHFHEIITDLTRMTRQIARRAFHSCLIRQSSAEIALDISRLKRYFNTVIFEVILESLRILQPKKPPAIDYNIMHNLLTLLNSGRTGAHQKITTQIHAIRNRNELIIGMSKAPDWHSVAVTPGQFHKNDYFCFKTEIVPVEEFKSAQKDPNIEFVDLHKLSDAPLRLRPWQKGDRIVPLGNSHSKKVSDIFIDQKIPLPKKKRIPLLTCGDSIVWICGMKLSDEYKVVPSTTRLLKLTYEELLS